MAQVSIMTMIDFYNAVAANEITPEVVAKAQELIAKDALDKEKAKAKRAEKVKEQDANTAVALGFLSDKAQTCGDLVAVAVANGMSRADGKDITPQYIAKLMKNLVDDGKAARTEVKGGKGKVKAYTLA